MNVNIFCTQKTKITENEIVNNFGVSPAWLISSYGWKFTIEQMISSVQTISESGFTSFQPELVSSDYLASWTCELLQEFSLEIKKYNMRVSQFVAHYLIDTFTTNEKAASDVGFSEFDSLLTRIKNIIPTSTITVPCGSWTSEEHFIEKNIIDRIKNLNVIAKKHGFRLALEIIPGFCLGGYTQTSHVLDFYSLNDVGFTLDTKHIVNAKDNLLDTIESISSKCFATHICDTPGFAGSSLRPGKGCIDWVRVLATLKSSGYKDSIDLEINCESTLVLKEYNEGREYLKKISIIK